MPVILTTEAERELWMSGTWADVQHLQRPLPDGALQVVATGRRKDGAHLDTIDDTPAAVQPEQPSLL